MKSMGGTFAYMAPEVTTGNYGIECDLWSAGCILYVLLSGTPPFYADTDAELLKIVKSRTMDFSDDVW